MLQDIGYAGSLAELSWRPNLFCPLLTVFVYFSINRMVTMSSLARSFKYTIRYTVTPAMCVFYLSLESSPWSFMPELNYYDAQ